MSNIIWSRWAAGVLFVCTWLMACSDTPQEDTPPRSLTIVEPSSSSHWACSAAQCTRWVAPNSTGYGQIKGAGIAPGSRICLQPGRFSAIGIEDLHGTSAQPIEIINCGGHVSVGDLTGYTSGGIQIRRSSHLRLTGTGHPATTYGIKVEGTSSHGVSIYAGSTDMEVQWLEVTRTGFAGITAKSDPGCNGEYARGTFTQYNTRLHHNYIHHTGSEGFYVGHYSYYGYTDHKDCKGTLLYPHELVGVRIYDNLIQSTGADGLQVGAAVADVEVYGNIIDGYGTDPFQNWQDNGIQIGEGTTGRWYGNLIKNGPRTGTGDGNALIIIGQGNLSFFNNIMENTGGVYLHREIPAGSEVSLLNNTFARTWKRGIKSANGSASFKVHNNVMVHEAGVIPLDVGSNVTASHNLFTTDINVPKFVDPSTGKYCLRADSPARDAGLSLSTYLTNDFYGRPRNDGAFDLSAYEYSATSSPCAIFMQDFSSSTSVADYVSAASPAPSQFNDISAEATGGNWSIQGGRLQLVRTGSSATDNDAGLARWTDLAGPPSVLHLRLSLGVSGWTSSPYQNDALCLDVGNFSGGFDYNSAGALGNIFNSLCIDGVGSGAYALNTAGGWSGRFDTNGTEYAISYFLNRSGAVASYRGPDGTMKSLQPNHVAVWVGTTLHFDDVAASNGSSSALTDFRMRWSHADNATWTIDNVLIENTLPQ
jgi:hypothetical protein